MASMDQATQVQRLRTVMPRLLWSLSTHSTEVSTVGTRQLTAVHSMGTPSRHRYELRHNDERRLTLARLDPKPSQDMSGDEVRNDPGTVPCEHDAQQPQADNVRGVGEGAIVDQPVRPRNLACQFADRGNRADP
jgi:hypothetical protein